jgi:galactarate dehydratase
MESPNTGTPRSIRMHDNDNVAIVANDGGLPAGAVFPDGLVLKDKVPQGHKVALRPIAQGDAILRYNVTIGYALRDIEAGSWVEESLVGMPPARGLDNLPIATIRPSPCLRSRATPSKATATRTVRSAPATSWPSAPRCSACPAWSSSRSSASRTSCCPCTRTSTTSSASTTPTAAASPSRRPAPRSRSAPCATSPRTRTSAAAPCWSAWAAKSCSRRACSRPAHPIRDVAGPTRLPAGQRPRRLHVDDRIHHGHRRAQLMELNARRRETCPAADLVVGVQCGGSDAFSGVTANPAVGFASDLLVRAGAAVMFSEVTEVRDGIDQLTARAVDGRGPGHDPRDGLVRRLPEARRRRPQRQHHARQQEGRPGQHRRKGDGLDHQVGRQPRSPACCRRARSCSRRA